MNATLRTHKKCDEIIRIMVLLLRLVLMLIRQRSPKSLCKVDVKVPSVQRVWREHLATHQVRR